MGTKKTTTTDQTQKTNYAPGALNGYNAAQGQALGMVNNPYGNQFYQQTLTQGMNSANQINQNQQQNLSQNISRSGIGENSAAGAMLHQMGGYMASHNQAGAFLNASNQAQSMYGQGMNFLSNPLATGGTMHGVQTEQSGGLGTWLPQVAGMALGAASGGLSAAGGGAKAVASGMMKGASSGLGGMNNGGGNAAGGSMGWMPSSNSGPSSFFSGVSPMYQAGQGLPGMPTQPNMFNYR